MNFFEKLFSLKWYFYVFTIGMVLGIGSLIMVLPELLDLFRFVDAIIEILIFIAGIITFPWIQLALHGRFSRFTMWWLKNFGRAYINGKNLRGDERVDKLTNDIVKNIFIAFLKLLEDILVFFLGFIIIFFVLNKAFARAYQYGYLKPKYQDQAFENLVDTTN